MSAFAMVGICFTLALALFMLILYAIWDEQEPKKNK